LKLRHLRHLWHLGHLGHLWHLGHLGHLGHLWHLWHLGHPRHLMPGPIHIHRHSALNRSLLIHTRLRLRRNTQHLRVYFPILSQNLRHGSLFSLHDFIHSSPDSRINLMKITSTCTDLEVHVSLLRDVLFAHIADKSTASAFQLVTTVFFDNRQSALGAFANQSCGHRFLDGVTYFKTTFLFRFLASLRDMCLFLAEAATDFFAVRVQTSKFFVLFNRRTDCFEFAEWALFKTIDTRLCNFILLLQVLQPLHQLVTDHFPDQFEIKSRLTSTSVEAF
jgi:hypothetical protein